MIRPAQFSEFGWQQVLPFIEKQQPGGITLVAIEVSEVRNFPRVTVATFDADARKRLRRALKAEARRQSAEFPDIFFENGAHSKIPGVRNIAGPAESQQIPYGGVS